MMSPTLTIPSVAPPVRASAPAGQPAADGEDSAAFADALQHAQGERKPARTPEPRAAAAKPSQTDARATRPTQATDATGEPDAQRGVNAAHRDAAEPTVGTEPAAATPHGDDAPGGAPNTPQPLIIVIEPAVCPQPAGEAIRSAPRADTDDVALAIEDRPAPSRSTARVGGAHDLRAGPALPGHAASSDEPVRARDGGPSSSFHAAVEQAAVEAAAATAAATRAPTFERLPAEAAATPLTATPFAREAAAAAPGVDAKPAQATLLAAIDDADFGAALGTQVSLWVREGVQEARLQLHPAELGPVTVQIALEGQAAHVDFTAAVAATRESIEQSLPALAAALRESGFTLTGGGVASQSGQGGAGEGRRERAAADRGEGSGNDGAIDAGGAAAVPRRWTRSLLDVYA